MSKNLINDAKKQAKNALNHIEKALHFTSHNNQRKAVNHLKNAHTLLIGAKSNVAQTRLSYYLDRIDTAMNHAKVLLERISTYAGNTLKEKFLDMVSALSNHVTKFLKDEAPKKRKPVSMLMEA